MMRTWARALSAKLNDWAGPADPPKMSPVEAAVHAAFIDAGLCADHFDPGFDLSRAGKLNDVLDGASNRLGMQHPVRTVADVIVLLEEFQA